MTRKIPFEAIENFRDFGGYAAGDRQLKRGRLYRSAHQAEATEADLEALAALGLAVIVDLRRPGERQRNPSRRWDGFGARVIENHTEKGDEDVWLKFIAQADENPEAFGRYMVDYYRDAPYVDRHIDLYSRYFKALAEVDGPVLIHCAAGKDRTGILAALTHHLAGVHEDDILADFLLTNDVERFQRRAPLMAAHIESMTGRRLPDEILHMAMGVEAHYLDTAFKVIHERHGTLDAYLEQVLGVDPATRAAIEARILD